MRKLFLTTAIALLFATPAYADPGQGGGQGMQGDQGTNNGGGGGYVHITRVQQLQARLAYHLHEWEEYGKPTTGYSWNNIQRITRRQLPAALAAEAAGKPLPPILKENGQVSPLQTIY